MAHRHAVSATQMDTSTELQEHGEQLSQKQINLAVGRDIKRLIRKKNRERGWSLKELAAELNVSLIYLRSLSNGARSFRSVSEAIRHRLCMYLTISNLEFLVHTGEISIDEVKSVAMKY